VTDPTHSAAPPDHRRGRQRRLLRFLRIASAVVFAMAVVALLAGGEVGSAMGWATIVALIVVPLIRVVWLVLRWRRKRDWRFVAVGLGLIAIIAGALLIALWVSPA
jgi:glucose uptake protein GlcU